MSTGIAARSQIETDGPFHLTQTLTSLNHCPCRAQPTSTSMPSRNVEMHPFLMAQLPQELLFRHVSLIAHCIFYWCHQLQQLMKCHFEGLLYSEPTHSVTGGQPTSLDAHAALLSHRGTSQFYTPSWLGDDLDQKPQCLPS